MSRNLLLLLALLLPTGAALSQEAGQPEAPPPAGAPPPAAEQPKPREASPTPKAPPPPPLEESGRDVETLVPEDIWSGGYGGATMMYSRILDHDALFFGGRGGWIVNHRFVLGVAGFAMVTRVPPPAGAPNVGEDLRTEFRYGGLWLEYILFPDKLVHGSIGTLLAGGDVAYRRLRHTDREDQVVENDVVFAAEPVISLELNITRIFHLSVGAGYRYVGSVNLTGLRREDLSGFTGSVILKFGKF
ncbi:MAG TPA: hypothetical protein VNA24_04305 [Hyalangium sp.]|nr:hypothetical protein [Hyalangium sp.]